MIVGCEISLKGHEPTRILLLLPGNRAEEGSSKEVDLKSQGATWAIRISEERLSGLAK